MVPDYRDCLMRVCAGVIKHYVRSGSLDVLVYPWVLGEGDFILSIWLRLRSHHSFGERTGTQLYNSMPGS